MQMFAHEHSEVLREREHVQEYRSNPALDAVLPEHCSNGQTPLRNLVGSYVPDEGTFETFVDGAGI
jgi:hypothetical protein